MNKLFATIFIPMCLIASEDDPTKSIAYIANIRVSERIEDFKEQDRIFKNCQKILQAGKYEQDILDSVQKENEQKYLSKREKNLKKLKEKNNEDA